MHLNEVLARIEQADDIEINEIISAVIQRYKHVSPDWEILFLSLPRNDLKSRKESLDLIFALLKEGSLPYLTDR